MCASESEPHCPTHSLPGELTDQIIDHLSEDVHSLSACALVCRDWLPSSRYHLFYNTVWRPAIPGKTFGDLLQWLTAFPDPAKYVVRLTIDNKVSLGPRPQVVAEELELVLAQLPKLQEVLLRGVSLATHRRVGEVYVPAFRRSLEKLSVESSTTSDGTFYPMSRLLLLFSEIGCLKLRMVLYAWNPSLSSSTHMKSLESSLQIRDLRLWCEGDEETWTGYFGIFHILLHSQPRWPLRRLSVRLLSMAQKDALDSVILSCKSTLCDLDIFVPRIVATSTALARYIPSLYLEARSWRIPSLGECEALESLTLSVLTGAMPSSGVFFKRIAVDVCAASLDANTDIILSAPSTVRLVVIEFLNTYATSRAELVDVLAAWSSWDELDRALMQLPQLEAVRCDFIEDLTRWLESEKRTASAISVPRAHGAHAQSREGEECDQAAEFLRWKLPRTEAADRLWIRSLSSGPSGWWDERLKA